MSDREGDFYWMKEFFEEFAGVLRQRALERILGQIRMIGFNGLRKEVEEYHNKLQHYQLTYGFKNLSLTQKEETNARESKPEAPQEG